MKTLIIHDSVFGNTEQIAQAMKEALATVGDVTCIRVGDFTPDHMQGVGLLIVGSPTRAFRPTPAIVAFLKNITDGSLKGVKVAAFDTRMVIEEVNNRFLTFMVKVFGYAAEPMSKKLVKKGGSLIHPAEGFFVKGSEGPLKDGEPERAATWAKQVMK